MFNDKKISEEESIALITQMIQKAKASYYETGVGAILWGSVVAIASLVHYFELVYKFSIGFDIWIIALIAIVPQIIISSRERKRNKVKQYHDEVLNIVWMVFGISIFGLSVYQMIVPGRADYLIHQEGWQLMKHYMDGSKPDAVLKPFPLSVFSLYILLYAFPTLVTGLTKKFKPMIVGSVIAYILFIISCFVSFEPDLLLGALTAIVCWLIPGIILRVKHLKQIKAHV